MIFLSDASAFICESFRFHADQKIYAAFTYILYVFQLIF